MSDIGKIVGERIRSYRKRQGLSQEEAAHRASLHTTFIGEVERSDKSPTLESLEKICGALNISLEELFQQSQPVNKSKESEIVSSIVNRIHSLPMKDLQTISKMIDLMMTFKGK